MRSWRRVAILTCASAVWLGRIASAQDVETTDFGNQIPTTQELIDALKPRGLAVIKRARLQSVTFAFDSAELTPQAKETLANVAVALESAELGGAALRIEGHTDGTGTDTYNIDLSERRARAVKDYLVDEHRIAPTRLTTVGKGETEPANVSDPTAAENRRVEIINVPK